MMFKRVELQHAGPTALGILVPPGTKTVVVVRPRALAWDLLPARWDGDSGEAPRFAVFSRDEAAQVARRFIAALETTAVNPLETFGSADRQRVQLWLRTESLVWIVCKRMEGQTYQPITFASTEEAAAAAEQLAAVVHPPAEATQEYYFNTQKLA